MLNQVAPHAGAWIETSYIMARFFKPDVAPHAGAWIETARSPTGPRRSSGRPPCGGVD